MFLLFSFKFSISFPKYTCTFLLHLFKCFHLILIHFKTIPKENCFHSTIFGKQATKKQKILFLKKIVLIKLKINRIYVQ